jgi:hypothetical protein
MKIKFAKFFQYVDVPAGSYDKFEPRTSVNDAHHEITLHGNLLKIKHIVSGTTVIANLYNVSYFRTQDEAFVENPAPAAKGSPKAGKKQD